MISGFLAIFSQAQKAKKAEIERKRAEVRKRMEEASKLKKAKKGFMTPERKKKLRVSAVELNRNRSNDAKIDRVCLSL